MEAVVVAAGLVAAEDVAVVAAAVAAQLAAPRVERR